jgi:hypothetical protein
VDICKVDMSGKPVNVLGSVANTTKSATFQGGIRLNATRRSQTSYRWHHDEKTSKATSAILPCLSAMLRTGMSNQFSASGMVISRNTVSEITCAGNSVQSGDTLVVR